MRHTLIPALGLGSALALLLVCFRTVLFGGEQFAFRDAGPYYYPLHLRVQQEWRAGDWPLWDAWQNGGQPLLGNPMAAVLYPGKLIFALLPYAWGARLYVVAHTAWAFLGITWLCRSFGVSGVGASIAGLSYAFGAPILFQYCNVIFLVGAAWVPWGLCAVDRLVRQGRPSGMLVLAAVLAMQVLGGDPQAAYLTVVCGVGYALLLAAHEGKAPAWAADRWRRFLLVLGCVALWFLTTVVYAHERPAIAGWVGPLWLPALAAWGAAGGTVFWFGRRGRSEVDRLGPRLGLLGAAGLLAVALAAAQLIPVAEFTVQSSRMGTVRTLTLAKFSLEPYRLVECFWPNLFGQRFPENRTWIQVIPPVNDRQLWDHSLYVGGLVPLLFMIGAGFRRSPPWRAWLTLIAAVSLAASFGRFGSPLWWLRWHGRVSATLGPHDPLFSVPRVDGYVEDGVGSPYAVLAALLPGFGLFRYSSKLLTFTAAAGAVLAGVGWDEVIAGRPQSKRLVRDSALALLASAVALGLALVFRSPVVRRLSSLSLFDALTGPLDAAGAWRETQWALAQGVVIYAVGIALALGSRRRPGRAGALVLMVLAADLGLANARLIWTVPQSVLDARPEAVAAIAAEEAKAARAASPGPVRIHRMAQWHPERFLLERSAERMRELAEWERDTLQGLHGLPWGIAYCVTAGMLERDDYLLLFQPQTFPARAEVARALGVAPGQPVFYYPRRCYDLWGARYFLLPVRSEGWATEARGYAAFVPGTAMVYPDPRSLENAADRLPWAERSDWQLLRNQAVFPRAWIVHQARLRAPAADSEAVAELISTLALQNDAFWSRPERRILDPRVMSLIETDGPAALRGYLSARPAAADESLAITRSEPRRIELTVRLHDPGLVILADSHYPGWHLTIDGRPAPILRANRMMRGAAVGAGEHVLNYTYDPWSFRIGGVVSLLGLAALLVVGGRQYGRFRGKRES